MSGRPKRTQAHVERIVDESGGDIAVERRFSQLVSLPLRRLPRYPGSAVGYAPSMRPITTVGTL